MAGEINLDAGIFTIRAGTGLIIVLAFVCLLMLVSMTSASKALKVVKTLETDTSTL